jgi:hypothetical protein
MSALLEAIIAVVAAAILGIVIGWHFGRQSLELSTAKVEVKQEAAIDTKRAADQTTVAEEAKTYEAAEIAPLAAPVLRVCHYTPAASLPGANAAGPGTHAPAADHQPDPVPDQPGPNIGPGLLRAGTIVRAQVMQLQDYVNRVCQAKVP